MGEYATKLHRSQRVSEKKQDAPKLLLIQGEGKLVPSDQDFTPFLADFFSGFFGSIWRAFKKWITRTTIYLDPENVLEDDRGKVEKTDAWIEAQMYRFYWWW